MKEKTLLQRIDEKGSELIINFLFMLFSVFAIVCSYIFSERR